MIKQNASKLAVWEPGTSLSEVNGSETAIKVQYKWTVHSPGSARWGQFFSFDGGETWQHNWTAEHRRTG